MAGKMDAKIDYANSCLDKGMSRTEVVQKMCGKFGGSEGYYRTLVYILFRGSQYRTDIPTKAPIKTKPVQKLTASKKKVTPKAKPKAVAKPKKKVAPKATAPKQKTPVQKKKKSSPKTDDPFKDILRT